LKKRTKKLLLLVFGRAVLLGLVAAAPRGAGRQQAVQRLHDTERARDRQLAAAAAASRAQQDAAARAAALAAQRIQEAAQLRQIETRVDETSRALAAATFDRQSAEAEIARRTADIDAMLPLVLRLSRYPAETILAVPAPPDRALEGLLITRGLGAELAREVTELRRRQIDAGTLTHRISQEQEKLAVQRAEQQRQAEILDRQVAAAQTLERAAQDESGAAALAASLLAAKASDLRGAIEAMTAAQKSAAARAAQDAAVATRENGGAAAGARARADSLSKPAGPGLAGAAPVSLVAGHLLRAWGAPAEDGPAIGVTFGTAPAAFVASPCTGRIGFSGPFRSYGRMLIIECGAGNDFVLAGLGRLDAAVGVHVRAGEPLGRMPDSNGVSKSELYVELRRAGQPVDPMPYLVFSR
jgi:septal ring factor EnvC (AmiA/AmiB activator)